LWGRVHENDEEVSMRHIKPPRIKVPPKRIENAAVVYKRLFGYVRTYWHALAIAMIASVVYSGVDSWFVYFLKPLLNKGLVQKNQEFLHWAPILVLGVFLLRGIVSFFSTYYIASVSRSVIMHLRLDIFTHLQKLPAKFYDHATSGQIISIMLYSVEQVANASADILTTAVQSFFLVVGLLIVMFSISWKLSLLYFIIIPIIAVIMRVTSMRVRRLSLSIQTSMAEITNRTEENVEGYKVVRSFGGQAYEKEKFDHIARTNRQREMKVVGARSWSVSSVQLVAAMALSITLYIATLDISNSILSPGGFVALVAAMLALLKPMKDLTSMQNKLHRGLAGAQTVFELLDEVTESDSGAKTATRVQGKIEFKQVGFSYNKEKSILRDISFSVAPGQTVALVGRSGSGKSTLVSLLPRFYDNFSGDILLDDTSISDYRLADLRCQFSLVSQSVVLFNDTIANNIAYGRFGDVTEAEIIEAARAAYALDFIEQLPNGLHTLVGENGVLLSGGQRQRIAIARAILKKAPILILDEATSALDTESERYIQAALEELMRHCTTLVIAHRLSTVERADKIVVLDRGELIEMGSHQELLERDGSYAKLYKMQFNDVPQEALNA
jgi:subfamily B ATP-binding cassette protein MsbA